MKKILILLFIFLFMSFLSYAQMTGQLIQGTLKQGAAPNAVKVVLKSSASFSGQFTNVQFTLQIPDTIIPQPTVAIKANPLNAYIPTATYTTQVTHEGSFYNYLFAAVATGSPAYNFTTGTEVDALEVQLTGPDRENVTVRLASLANGGSTGQLYFYVEVSGNDNTNVTAMFYGTGVSNGGSYATYSYVPFSPVAIRPPAGSTGYFRTLTSGNWNSPATWESSLDNINWYPATLSPDSSADTITILGGHTVTLTANVTIDQVFVNTGGALVVDNGVVVTVSDGVGADLTLNGSLMVKSGGQLIIMAAN